MENSAVLRGHGAFVVSGLWPPFNLQCAISVILHYAGHHLPSVGTATKTLYGVQALNIKGRWVNLKAKRESDMAVLAWPYRL